MHTAVATRMFVRVRSSSPSRVRESDVRNPETGHRMTILITGRIMVTQMNHLNCFNGMKIIKDCWTMANAFNLQSRESEWKENVEYNMTNGF